MKILIDVPRYETGLAALQQAAACEIECVRPGVEDEPRALESPMLAEAEVLFCTYPPTNLAAMSALKWIQISSTGYGQLLGLDLVGRGIRATNSRGCFDIPIAEWNLAMMINLVRDLPQMLRNQAKAHWDRSAIFQRELRGLTVGIWGYGGIARETARLARQLGLNVHVLTRNGVRPRRNAYTVSGSGDLDGVLPSRQFRSGQEAEFLGGLDFLVLALPLTPASKGLIGERELKLLPRHAYLLNPARGHIVAEDALVKALRDGWIAGAALDTHYSYPLPAEHPLWRMPNVIITPHISGSDLNPQFQHRLWDLFVQNVARHAGGAPLLNELTTAELSGR